MIWSKKHNIKLWLPKLQAHRGYCVSGAMSNSLDSIIEAHKMGYRMAEFDVRLTSDDVVILFHDDHFKDNIIRLTPYALLNSQIKITTLEELFAWFEKTENFKLNIEIKSRDIFNYRLEQNVSRLIKKYKIEERVMVSSFNPFSLFKIGVLCPQIRRAILLTFEKDHGNNIFTRTLFFNFLCRPHMLNMRYDDFSDRFKKLTEKIPVVLWTVNDLSFYKKNKNDIHGIISDTITPDDLKEVDNA